MHPTRTTTKLLLGVACAVSAVSGCVNVSPTATQPAGTSTGLPPHHEPHGGPGAAVVVQAPALEALKTLPRESARPAASGSSRLPAPRSSGRAPAGPEEAAPPVPDIPEPRRPAKAAAGHPGGLPGPSGRGAEAGRELMRELPVRPADVCALGRRHGRWHPDSPEARICSGVHGG
ncbi:hypothetical protein [Streptomyces cirratus]|uniref:hypothetical protein n=1 Tax=Streptomyces cirratus TaxID=68187 RepID=UPI00167DB512|nr:hypothetical protein [Streptomyces cirratus]